MNSKRYVPLLLLVLSLASCGKKKPTVKLTGTHSVALSWTASTTPGVQYHIYRNSAVMGSTAAVTYTDASLPASTAFSYQVTSFCVTCNAALFSGESVPSATVSVTTPPDNVPPPPSGFNAGDRVKNLQTANVRSTAPVSGLGTLLGTVPAGSLGTVGTATQVPNTGGWIWIQVKFDTCSASIPNCTGYVGSDNLAVVTPVPPQPLTLTCVNNVCTVGGGTSGQTGQIQIIPGGPTATWKK